MSTGGTWPPHPRPLSPVSGGEGRIVCWQLLSWTASFLRGFAASREANTPDSKPARSGFRDEHEGEQVCAASLTGRVARGSRDQQLRVGLRNLFHRQIVLVIKQQSAG